MGKGYQGDDHYGMKKLDLGEAFAGNYYSKPLSDEDFQKGTTRFQSWHLDGPLYKVHPPYISSLRFIKLPQGEQKVEWADGSGHSLSTKPGKTAFVSTSQLYEMLSEEEKIMADNSTVEYMYYPYEWIRMCHGNPNGLSVANEGREKPFVEMEEMSRDPKWIKSASHFPPLFSFRSVRLTNCCQYPMVWINELTGEKGLQIQPNCVRRILLRREPNQTEPEVIEGPELVRAFLDKLQSRIIKPEYVYIGPEEEVDHVFWYNWGIMHSKIDYPVSYGPRIVHQGWIPSSRVPKGPQPLSASA